MIHELLSWVEEDHPEIVSDHVNGHLPTADRAFDEAHDRILRLVQHESVARRNWNILEGEKWVRRLLRDVGRKRRYPIGSVHEPGLQAL